MHKKYVKDGEHMQKKDDVCLRLTSLDPNPNVVARGLTAESILRLCRQTEQ